MRFAKLIAGMLVTAAVTAVGSHSVLAATTYKLGYVLPKNSHFGVCASTFADEVAKRTGGRIEIEQEGGMLGGEASIIEGLQLTTQDIGLVTTGPIGTHVPEAGIIDVPFLFRDYAHARAVLDGPIGQELLAAFSKRDMTALAWGENGFRHITTSTRAVQAPKDLEGLKIRTQQNKVHIEAFTALGVKATPLPFNELYAAMQQGLVDGEENTIPVIVQGEYNKVQKHLTLSSHVYSPTVLIMSTAVWSALSDDDKKAVQEAAKVAVKAMRAAVEKSEQEGVAKLEMAGMQVVRKIDTAAFQSALAPAYAEYAKQFGQDKIDRIRTTQP